MLVKLERNTKKEIFSSSTGGKLIYMLVKSGQKIGLHVEQKIAYDHHWDGDNAIRVAVEVHLCPHPMHCPPWPNADLIIRQNLSYLQFVRSSTMQPQTKTTTIINLLAKILFFGLLFSSRTQLRRNTTLHSPVVMRATTIQTRPLLLIFPSTFVIVSSVYCTDPAEGVYYTRWALIVTLNP